MLHKSDDATMTDKPVMNILFLPKASVILPTGTTKMAAESRKPVIAYPSRA